MTQDTAAVATSPDVRDPARGTWVSLVVWAVGGLCAWAVVLTAARLRADGRGFGTHEQLGLPPCAFSTVTHLPCPGCGLTTSFADMAHGHVVRAFVAHPMGPLLFALTLFVAAFAPYAIARRRPVAALLDATPMIVALALTAGTGVVTWSLRLAHVIPWR